MSAGKLEEYPDFLKCFRYSSQARDIDDVVATNSDFLVVVSSGNEGTGSEFGNDLDLSVRFSFQFGIE